MRILTLIFVIGAALLVVSTPLSQIAVHTSDASSGGKTRLVPLHIKIPHSLLSSSNPVGEYRGSMSILIFLKYANSSMLSRYLADLNNPHSAYYHRYLSPEGFDRLFGLSPSTYSSIVRFFSSMGHVNVSTFSDHNSLLLSGKSSYFSRVMNTQIILFSHGGRFFHSITKPPRLPSWIASKIGEIIGLTPLPKAGAALHFEKRRSDSIPPIQYHFGYPAPLLTSGTHSIVQFLWGSDFQRAYAELPILNESQKGNISIVNIMWSGHTDLQQPTAPFYPPDVYGYLNTTLPPWEMKPKIYAIPVNGAPSPGSSSQKDITGASVENTLDLEMLGSLAPGSRIYDVYGPDHSISSILTALDYALNPNYSLYPGLYNLRVITNSWTSRQMNLTAWNDLSMEAEARGITILAASGDSGDNRSSSKYTGSFTSFPGCEAFGGYGVTSVGGTTMRLNLSNASQVQYLKPIDQVAWFVNGSNVPSGDTLGSEGGIDLNISEPVWQSSSLANNILGGRGRGVPDISAVANNTIIFITLHGVSYYGGSSGYIVTKGTSISSPVLAGIVAEIDSYLAASGEPPLGYLNPLLYRLGNAQYGFHQGRLSLGGYLFEDPYFEILSGHNSLYREQYGYSLVTGLGTPNVINITHDVVHDMVALPIYAVNFTIATGNSSGVLKVTVDNNTVPWNKTHFILFLNNGTYHYTVKLKNSTLHTLVGAFTVNGTSLSIVIQPNQTEGRNHPFTTLSGWLVYSVLGAIALFISLILLATRRRRW